MICSETLLLRINTLHRKRKSATEDVADSPVVSTTTTRSPKRLKANDLNAVEYPAPQAPVSSSQRLKGLLSRGWRSVLQILEPSKTVETMQDTESRTKPPAHVEEDDRESTAPQSQALVAPERESFAPIPVASAKIVNSVTQVGHQRVLTQEVTARRASVLARAKELEGVLQRDATPVLPRSQSHRSTSTTSSLARRFATPDASSSRPILNMPRRRLGSPQASPSVKNMIQSFERSFEKDEAVDVGKTDSPVSQELRRLSSRRSVSGNSSLREVLEAGMGGAKHTT